MKVISNAKKLIFRPNANAPVVDFPKGVIVSAYSADNEAPTVVVQNATTKEKSWQGVSFKAGSTSLKTIFLSATTDYQMVQ